MKVRIAFLRICATRQPERQLRHDFMVFFDINTSRILSLFLFFFPFSPSLPPFFFEGPEQSPSWLAQGFGPIGQRPKANRQTHAQPPGRHGQKSRVNVDRKTEQTPGLGPGAKRNAKKNRDAAVPTGGGAIAVSRPRPKARPTQIRNSRSLWRRKNVSAPC